MDDFLLSLMCRTSGKESQTTRARYSGYPYIWLPPKTHMSFCCHPSLVLQVALLTNMSSHFALAEFDYESLTI